MYVAELMGQRNTQYLMPVPQMNIINGGVHADNPLAIQEFMILPLGAPTFSEALRWGVETFHCLKSYLKKQGFNTNVGDEGGFAPNFQSHQEAIENILVAIEQAGYKPGKDIYLGLDAASNEFYHQGKYCLENKELNAEQWITYLEHLVQQYPIITIEDGMAESDEPGWIQLTQRLGKKIQLVGDDLFVTNPVLFQQGINKNLANAILIKLNQIGTVSETLEVISLAKQADYAAIISHRSGETEDTSIADLAVGTGVGQIKTGSVCRTDRTAKYNRLLRIEAELAKENKVSYAVILTVLFLSLQYKLWFVQDGVWRVHQLKKQIAQQLKENIQLSQRNTAMVAEIKDLKSGKVALEAHAPMENQTIANLWRRRMSILKLRANLVEKIKDFGSSFHPTLKKPLEELNFPIKNVRDPLPKILSIDDNKICQKINVNNLQKFGCVVECVNSARSALDKLSSAYEIILVDVNLPDCGIDLLINLIRSDERNVNQKVPIVLTSSWLHETCKKNYLAIGINEVYIKPMQENDFKKILQNYGVIA
ncbi:hypothetical protein FQR65_LT05239 [Abscondita terminalis]|nr:hypothetical protein FQR65_LT05239 [Abscondita terminalis]